MAFAKVPEGSLQVVCKGLAMRTVCVSDTLACPGDAGRPLASSLVFGPPWKNALHLFRWLRHGFTQGASVRTGPNQQSICSATGCGRSEQAVGACDSIRINS